MRSLKNTQKKEKIARTATKCSPKTLLAHIERIIELAEKKEEEE